MELLLYSSEEEEELVETQAQRNSSDRVVEPEDLVLYSQNFAANQGMNSLFLYMLWYPQAVLRQQLKDFSESALKTIIKSTPALTDKYKWHFVGTPSALVEGRYSITNMRNLDHLHVTLQNNVNGEEETIEKVRLGFKNAIELMEIPKSLICNDVDEQSKIGVLQNILGLEHHGDFKKQIQLQFEDRVMVCKNFTNPNLFLAHPLSMKGEQGKFFIDLETRLNKVRVAYGFEPFPLRQPHVTTFFGEPVGDAIDSESREAQKVKKSYLERDNSGVVRNFPLKDMHKYPVTLSEVSFLVNKGQVITSKAKFNLDFLPEGDAQRQQCASEYKAAVETRPVLEEERNKMSSEDSEGSKLTKFDILMRDLEQMQKLVKEEKEEGRIQKKQEQKVKKVIFDSAKVYLSKLPQRVQKGSKESKKKVKKKEQKRKIGMAESAQAHPYVFEKTQNKITK